MDRAGIGEDMCRPYHDVNQAVYVLGRIVKAGIGGINMRMAGLADGARREAGMDSIGRRKAMAGAATGRRQVGRIVPTGRFVGASGKRGAVAIDVGTLEIRCCKDRA